MNGKRTWLNSPSAHRYRLYRMRKLLNNGWHIESFNQGYAVLLFQSMVNWKNERRHFSWLKLLNML